MLTICIPTYNRGPRVRERLIELIPQLDVKTQILVIDNASDVAVNDFVNDIILEQPNIYVVRNKYNVGMSANIARCLELPDSEWVWILGDDDAVRDDAIEKIHSDIAGVSNSVDCIKYSSYCGENSKNEIVDIGMILSSERLNYEFVANFFLISSTVLRVKKLSSLDGVMNTLNSMVPHVVAIFELMIAGSQLKLSTTHVVNNTKSAQSWLAIHLEANLNLVVQFAKKTDGKYFLQLVRFFSQHLYFNPVRVFFQAHKIALKSNRIYANYLYRMVLASSFVGKAPIKKVIGTLFLWFLFRCQADKLLPFVFRIRGGAAKVKYEKFMT